MIKKIITLALKIVVWSVCGVVVFYLIAGFILFPLVVPPLVKWQGSKILSRPVLLHRAFFNPLTLALQLSDFKIENPDQSEIVGFKKARMEVDVPKLFKKKYVIKSIIIDGLNANVVLLPGNRLNLIDLMPATPQAAKKNTQKFSLKSLPYLAINSIAFNNARVAFNDKSIGVGFVLNATDTDLAITG
jgi:uncharacterized protein involved in outer membrane biogenesis